MSDVLLTAIAFEAAYQTRLRWQVSEFVFYLTGRQHFLLLLFAGGIWVLLGRWLGIYGRLDSANPRVLIQDTSRQCGLGAIALVLFEYTLRLDLSRAVVGLIVGYNWVLLLPFRWTAGRLSRPSPLHFFPPPVIPPLTPLNLALPS